MNTSKNTILIEWTHSKKQCDKKVNGQCEIVVEWCDCFIQSQKERTENE
jgi:hypothetical protein